MLHGTMKKWVGTRQFYKRLLYMAVPIMVQNLITNFVGFLDNIMVGQLGTEPMSGVAIVNQLVFVFNLLVFGGLSGAGIFGAQFYGKGDDEGVRATFRFKIILGALIVVFTLLVLIFAGESLIRLYLTSGNSENLQMTFEYGRQYLLIIFFEILPFVLVQVYASTLRETGQTMVPMIAGIVAVLVNLFFNYLLIFGKFGAPELGGERLSPRCSPGWWSAVSWCSGRMFTETGTALLSGRTGRCGYRDSCAWT